MSRRTWTASRPQQKFIPAFTVTKLEGTYQKPMVRSVEFGKPGKNGERRHKLEHYMEETPRGYLVSFPRGHSIHIDTVEELYEQGYGDPEIPLVEPDGGEVVGSQPNMIRREKSKEKVDA